MSLLAELAPHCLSLHASGKPEFSTEGMTDREIRRHQSIVYRLVLLLAERREEMTKLFLQGCSKLEFEYLLSPHAVEYLKNPNNVVLVPCLDIPCNGWLTAYCMRQSTPSVPVLRWLIRNTYLDEEFFQPIGQMESIIDYLFSLNNSELVSSMVARKVIGTDAFKCT